MDPHAVGSGYPGELGDDLIDIFHVLQEGLREHQARFAVSERKPPD
jgi:hypothetical protein